MLEVFTPLLEAARGLDLTDAAAAEAALAERLAPGSAAAAELNARLRELLEAGELAKNGELPVRWGRVAKATEETLGYSVDVVHMTGPGPLHRHPNGEIDWCVSLDGAPTFDGRSPGWVAYQPGSEHVPTVAGGAMLIVYLLPQGRIEFL